jgi:segregation and condensation protein B
VVNHTEFEQSETLAVSDTGELIAAEETYNEAGEPHVNGHSFELSGDGDGNGASAENSGGDEPVEETPTESLQDEIAGEDFITDEIFAAEDEVEEEEKLEEGLSSADDTPQADNPSGDQTNNTDEEENKE